MVADLQPSARDMTNVEDIATDALGICELDRRVRIRAVLRAERAVICDLSAHLGIERRAVEDHRDRSRVVRVSMLVKVRAVPDCAHSRCERLRIKLRCVIGCVNVQCFEFRNRVRWEVKLCVSALHCATLLARFFHKSFVASHIDAEVFFLRHHLREIDRESKRVMQLECILRGDSGCAALLHACCSFTEQCKAALKRATELHFFIENDLCNACGVLLDFRKRAAECGFHCTHEVMQEGTAYAHRLMTVANRATKNATKDIAASLVGRRRAIGDREREATDVIRDHAIGDVGYIIESAAIRTRISSCLNCGKNGRPQVRVVV